MRVLFSLIITLFLSGFLSGCGTILTITSLSTATVVLGYKHSKAGGLQAMFKDSFMESKIERLWEESEIDEPFLFVCSLKNTPVIMGAATSASNLEKAKAIAFSKSENVQCIADPSISGGWNTALENSIKLKLMLDAEISSRNYYVKAMRNRVWIAGIAQSAAEKARVLERMGAMKGVGSFEHYIIVSSDTLEDGLVVHEAPAN